MTDRTTQVLIAGGGFAGLSLAIALRQALGSRFRVSVADPTLARRTVADARASDARASAIAASTRRMLEAIGVWDALAPGAQPILDMVITDSRLGDAVRPTFLTFAGEVEPGEPFAWMIENAMLLEALGVRADREGVELLATSVDAYEAHAHGVTGRLADGATIAAELLVAADGARSRLRDLAGIGTIGWEYRQSAIVTTVAHARDHEGRAIEHFLPAGPFAILPLTNRRASLVWVEATQEADRIVALDDAPFLDELEARFGLHLGALRLAGPRQAYPLGLTVARSFVADRFALVGDAAHRIHPIAGQGLNLGLRDAAALAESIADAARLGLDIGGPDVLERYQRWRRFDTTAMGIATDGINRLFSNGSDLLRLVRDLGLGLVDRAPALKQMFIRQAAGVMGDTPRLMRGETL